MGNLKKLNAKEGYVFSPARQNKDINGNFTFNLDDDVLKNLKDLKVYNTQINQLEDLNP